MSRPAAGRSSRANFLVVDAFTVWAVDSVAGIRQVEPWEIRQRRTDTELYELGITYDVSSVWVLPSVAVEPDPRQLWRPLAADAARWWRLAYRDTDGEDSTLVFPGDREGGADAWLDVWSRHERAEQLARALYDVSRAVRPPFRNPATTGTLLLADSLARNETWRQYSSPPVAPVVAGKTEREIVWKRPFTAEERGLRWVHSYDKHAMFLGACASLSLGVGAYEQVSEPTREDTKRPGYWHIEIVAGHPDPRSALLPAPREVSAVVTTPTLNHLLTSKITGAGHIKIGHGVFWPRGLRALDNWYAKLRDARAASPRDSSTADAIKAMYTQTIGRLGARGSKTWERSKDPFWRPDWREAVIATANTNLLRRLDLLAEAGHPPPFAIATDCLYYATDCEDPRAFAAALGLNLGSGIGQWAVKDAAVPLSDVRPFVDDTGVSLVALLQWLNRRRDELAQ